MVRVDDGRYCLLNFLPGTIVVDTPDRLHLGLCFGKCDGCHSCTTLAYEREHATMLKYEKGGAVTAAEMER